MKKTETFENMMQKLEQIVAALEKGDCGLEESLKLFEEGVALTNQCEKRLSDARQTIKTLSQAEEEVQND